MSALSRHLETLGALLFALIWISPLVFAFWAAFHTTSDAVNFNVASPWTLDNFRIAWAGAPWLRYFLNTFLLVTVVLVRSEEHTSELQSLMRISYAVFCLKKK